MTTYGAKNIIPFPRQGESRILQIRVDLLLVKEPVWRRLLVPDGIDFWELHVALQDAMGWEDCHLHQFVVDHPDSGERERIGVPDDSGFHGVSNIVPGWQKEVLPYLSGGGHPLLYTYDFGDDWRHEVILEEVREDDRALVLPSCIDGQGQCPAEDSGGAPFWTPATGEDAAVFDPGAVVFENPQRRWRRMFGKD